MINLIFVDIELRLQVAKRKGYRLCFGHGLSFPPGGFKDYCIQRRPHLGNRLFVLGARQWLEQIAILFPQSLRCPEKSSGFFVVLMGEGKFANDQQAFCANDRRGQCPCDCQHHETAPAFPPDVHLLHHTLPDTTPTCRGI